MTTMTTPCSVPPPAAAVTVAVAIPTQDNAPWPTPRDSLHKLSPSCTTPTVGCRPTAAAVSSAVVTKVSMAPHEHCHPFTPVRDSTGAAVPVPWNTTVVYVEVAIPSLPHHIHGSTSTVVPSLPQRELASIIDAFSEWHPALSQADARLDAVSTYAPSSTPSFASSSNSSCTGVPETERHTFSSLSAAVPASVSPLSSTTCRYHLDAHSDVSVATKGSIRNDLSDLHRVGEGVPDILHSLLYDAAPAIRAAVGLPPLSPAEHRSFLTRCSAVAVSVPTTNDHRSESAKVDAAVSTYGACAAAANWSQNSNPYPNPNPKHVAVRVDARPPAPVAPQASVRVGGIMLPQQALLPNAGFCSRPTASAGSPMVGSPAPQPQPQQSSRKQWSTRGRRGGRQAQERRAAKDAGGREVGTHKVRSKESDLFHIIDPLR